jgi:ABC-type branched-subunit amino acid transport system substrate-binding protein
VTRKEGKRGVLQTEATFKAEIINIAEYLKTTNIENQFINIVKSHESNQPNMNATIKAASKFGEELNKSNENWDTNRDGIQHIKAKLGGALKS